MEIELITAKKKLTASLIKQMPILTTDDAQHVLISADAILGYVTVNNINYAICKGKADYVKLNISAKWHKGKEAFAMVNNGYVEFVSQEVRDEWLHNVEQITDIARDKHIYI